VHASRILAIDTATEVCSVAVLDDRELVELAEAVGQRHSERILAMIDAALTKARLKLDDIDGIAFGAGPGSFTGLRIACGIAQGLGYGKRKPVVAIGNLRALAARAFATEKKGDTLLAAIDARMREAYCAVYRRDAAVSEVTAPMMAGVTALAQMLANEDIDIVAGNALRVFPEVWPGDTRWRALPEVTPTAADIAFLARIDAERGLAVAPEQAAPLYVRDRVAMTVQERRTLHASKQRNAVATG
jgi:tRNA threonylcarbamoyladenosine biosynthesis protein TsaB